MPVSLTPTLSRKRARGQTNRCASFALTRMTRYKQPVSVLVVIHTVDLEVLLLERADHPGYWQSVTGSCEAGEALADPDTRRVLKLMAPAVLAVSVAQVSLVINTHIASRLTAGSERPDVIAAMLYGFGDLVDRADLDRRLRM